MRRCYLTLIVTLGSVLIAIDLATFAAPVHRIADGLTGYRLQYLGSAAILLTLLLLFKPRGLVRVTRWGLALVIIHQCYWLLPSLRPHSQVTS